MCLLVDSLVTTFAWDLFLTSGGFEEVSDPGAL
jgi:hypothetical protein